MNELLLQLDAAQLVGLIAAFICVSAFLCKDEKKFTNTLLLYCIVGSIHFFMVNAYIAAMSALLNAIRIQVSKKTKSTLVMLGFIFAFLILCNLNFIYFYELLPIIGSIVGTYGLFKLTGIKLRFSFFV